MSARDRVEDALLRAHERGDLGAFWRLDDERALEAADAIDSASGGAVEAPLGGAPVAVKDLFDVAGLPTSAGISGKHPPAARDAVLVRRLRAAGGVPVGKTAMDPLGASTGGQAPGFPPCINPVDERLSPGGSSSGSAVAVAAGIVPFALGSDTAGSTRIPAAYCGITGFKPALGLLPRGGCVPAMPSFDAPGLLAKDVEACVRLATALSARGPGTPRPRKVLRIGLLADLVETAEPAVAEACRELGGRLAGAEGIEVSELPLDWRAPGFGLALAYELAETWGSRVDADPGRFTELIRGTIEFGRKAGRVKYERAMAGLSRARRSLGRRLAGIDAVLCPTVPVATPDRDEEEVGVSTGFTRLFNALNWHAFSLPAGRDGDGRPVAVQIASAPPRMPTLIEVARRAERELGSMS